MIVYGTVCWLSVVVYKLMLCVLSICIDGCVCFAGYHGNSCRETCQAGWFGIDCRQQCSCENSADCDIVTGRCTCLPGYNGTLCQYSK